MVSLSLCVHVNVFTDHKCLQYVFTQKEINIKQMGWLELLKDYDMNILYHPRKANVVDDSLSRSSMGSTSYFEDDKKELTNDVHTCTLRSSPNEFHKRRSSGDG